MASALERPVTHSETPFLGRADKNFRETVSLMQCPPEHSEPWVPWDITTGQGFYPWSSPSLQEGQASWVLLYSPSHAFVASLPRL